nr:reverse transcriptase domain-containing protein [Tanacetum cinerariifolium]
MQTHSSSRLIGNPSSNPTTSTNPNPKGRNRRHSKQRIEEFNLDELSPPIVRMADQHTMAQLLQAPTEGYKDAIVDSAITVDNFELKHGLLTLVQNKQFFGHDKEDPHAHIRYFNKITSTLKFLNVPNMSIKLMLFPFSLEGAARICLEKEPPRSIFTWDDLVSKFINQFFPPSKTTNLQLHQLDTLYNALNSKDQDSLNSSAGGNFLDKMPRECLAIIESKSKVHYSRNKPVVAKVSTNTSTSVEESYVTCGGAHSYRNCPATDGNIYRDNIQEFVSQASAVNYNQGNTSYRPPMISNQIRPPGQNMQNQLTNLTELITKFVNSNSASTLSSGTLPSNTIANSRSDLKAITTRSSVSYDGPQILPLPSFLHKVVEIEPEATKDTPVTSSISEPVIALVSAPKPNPKSSILYPSRRNDERNHEKANNQIEKFYQLFKDLSFEISFADALILMPKFASTLKALIRNKEKLTLADLDASINLMPLSVWNKLSLPDLSPTCMNLKLVDRSISHSVGVAEDVYVKVGSFHFPADFVVVDFDANPRVPLILGRSFLKTGRALIDVFEGELTLRIGKEAITFNLDQTSRYLANYSDMTAKRIDVLDMACVKPT